MDDHFARYMRLTASRGDLIGGDKTGDDRWYEVHVPIDDRLYDEHLELLRQEGLLDG